MKTIFKFIFTLSALFLFSLSAVAETSVTFWHMEGVPHRVDRIQILIDEFNQENPDIVVKQEVQSWGDIYAYTQFPFIPPSVHISPERSV